MNIETLHWLRPGWLVCAPLLALAWVWVLYRVKSASAWQEWVDPELQEHVLDAGGKGSKLGISALFLSWILCVLMLAGPVWEQQPVPVFEARPSLVAVVDISPSMDLNDLQPSRMQRAVFKLTDFINQAKGVDIGLLVFAERPYVVSPLTDDVKTLSAFLPSISTELAPVRGSRLNLAIDKAVELLQQAGKPIGHVVVFSDAEIFDEDIEAASAAKAAGYLVSMIGVGTKTGAPLRTANQEFVRDEQGSVVVPKIDINAMRKLASAGGGIARTVSASSSDIDAVFQLSDELILTSDEAADENTMSDYWVEQSVWLLPVLLLLGLGLFRRGLAL